MYNITRQATRAEKVAALATAQDGQSVKIRTTEKPQNPHTEQKII